MTMIRRSFLASLAAASLAVAAGPAFARQLSLGEVSSYLNQLQSASSGFTQINGDGSIQTGTMYIKRPGRIRFEYQGDRSMMIAGGGQVAVFDARSNAGPERYPLNQTPLNIILERNVDLGRAGMVTGHTSDGTKTTCSPPTRSSCASGSSPTMRARRPPWCSTT